jgi:hypothetical protein
MDKLIIGGEVNGNVTSCLTETLITNINKESFLSLKQTTHYSVMDSCTRQILSSYSVPEFSWSGVFILPFIFILSYFFMDMIKVIWRGYDGNRWY